MTKLLEKTVQEKAHHFLRKRYKSKARKGRIFAQLEVRTRLKYGGKRADGVLAFQHWLFGPYVVSMEAKSTKTLSAIKPYRSDWQLVRNSIWMGFLICVTTGAFFALFKMNDGQFQFLIPLNFMVIGGLVYGAVTVSSSKHKRMDVIKQLNQYPANEKWLAFSKDSVFEMNHSKRRKLLNICRRKGVGLLLVKKRGAPEVWTTPRMKWKWFGDYLSYYSKEKEMRKIL